MKIFLTGSTGFLGTKFVDMYGKDFEIFGVARKDVEHPLDLHDAEGLERAYKSFDPDVVIHTAAHPSRDTNNSDSLVTSTVAVMQQLIDLALPKNIPFIFTSTEALYGGKEQTGGYIETDKCKPRNKHGESKLLCEQVLIESGLPYLITRGHRYVGISKRFHAKKNFPDTLNSLIAGEELHLDTKKIFTPVLINHIADIFAHHIRNHIQDKLVLNVGVDKDMTYYDFTCDVAGALGFDKSLIHNDGDESGWVTNSSISVKKLYELGYPAITYNELLKTIARDYFALKIA